MTSNPVHSALARDELLALLVCRIQAAIESLTSYNGSHIDGQIRGIIAALGYLPPPSVQNGETAVIFNLVGIPYVREIQNGEPRNQIDREWMRSVGFDMQTGVHGRFSGAW